MKVSEFILGAAAGALAYHIFMGASKKTPQKASTIEEQVKMTVGVIQEEAGKYSDVLKKQYDIVMPSDQIAQKVKRKGKQFTEDRYAINLNRVKQPLSI